MFVSPWIKEIVAGSSDTTVPLYRECMHPRIPQMAVIGYSEGLNSIYAIEMMSKWVARFLDGAFRLPSVRRMEQSVAEWDRYMKQSNGESFRRSCLGAVNIRYNDQLCRDMGCDPRRKKGFLAELFQPYGPVDYAGIQGKLPAPCVRTMRERGLRTMRKKEFLVDWLLHHGSADYDSIKF